MTGELGRELSAWQRVAEPGSPHASLSPSSLCSVWWHVTEGRALKGRTRHLQRAESCAVRSSRLTNIGRGSFNREGQGVLYVGGMMLKSSEQVGVLCLPWNSSWRYLHREDVCENAITEKSPLFTVAFLRWLRIELSLTVIWASWATTTVLELTVGFLRAHCPWERNSSMSGTLFLQTVRSRLTE